MKPSPAAKSDVTPPLVRLLDQSFLAGDDRDAGVAAALPAALWNRALLDPLREFLGRPSKEFRARMLIFGFRAGGGDPADLPPQLPLLIEYLHAGSLIIDDIEDDSHSRRGAPAVHRRHGLPVALNAGNWLYYWAQVLLSRLPLGDPARLLAHERLAASLLRCHEGQALDLTVRVEELAQEQVPLVVEAITSLKTGSLVGLATFLGALAAGARGERLEAISCFGRDVGTGLQMFDDLSGILNVERRHKGIEDLQQRRATWVWAWLARHLPAENYQKLRNELCEMDDSSVPEALIERIRFGLGGAPLVRPRAHFDGTVAALYNALGRNGWGDELHNELHWLEEQYVQG